MKTDRELLELAAKVAGYVVIEWVESYGDYYAEDFAGLIIRDGYKNEQRWNPLTDDGDALRLAVKLGIVVSGYDCSAISGARLNQGHQDWVYGDPEEELDDEAAARRAIVRAAAAIGEAMQ